MHTLGKRCRWLLWIALTAAGAAACENDSAAEDPQLLAGQQLYGTYCALCHGAEGEGYRSDAANALGNPSFLATASHELLWTGTARGRPGTPMSAWGQDRGGPLSDADVEAIVAWIRHWQQGQSIAVDQEVVEGVADRALPLYEFNCASCHGSEGQGQPYLSLRNPEFLAVASDGYLRYATSAGRPNTPMPAFNSELTAQGIGDLVTLIRSWQQPPDQTPYEPPSTDLGDVVVNLGGPEPTFFEDQDRDDRFIAADLVLQAIDEGYQLALLDARPPSDYVQGHITGGVSVPFYLAETYLDQLDPSWTYVSYCGCPHSISGQLLDLLRAHGYPKVWVLDEGFFVWQERGYPVTIGPTPY